MREELEELAETGGTAADVVELDQARVGRLSRMDALQSQAMSQASGRRREQLRKSIDAALARIENDEYGFGES
jgi:DnaK suppressor protein